MKRLNEKEIIKIINSKHVSSEDVEIFNLGNEQCAVCVDTLVESTDIPKGSKLSNISRSLLDSARANGSHLICSVLKSPAIYMSFNNSVLPSIT